MKQPIHFAYDTIAAALRALGQQCAGCRVARQRELLVALQQFSGRSARVPAKPRRGQHVSRPPKVSRRRAASLPRMRTPEALTPARRNTRQLARQREERVLTALGFFPGGARLEELRTAGKEKGLPDVTQQTLWAILNRLAARGQVKKVEGRYFLGTRGGTVPGTVVWDGTRKDQSPTSLRPA